MAALSRCYGLSTTGLSIAILSSAEVNLESQFAVGTILDTS